MIHKRRTQRARFVVPSLIAAALIAASCSSSSDSADSTRSTAAAPTTVNQTTNGSTAATDGSTSAASNPSSDTTSNTTSNSTSTGSDATAPSVPPGSVDPYADWFPSEKADISGPGVTDSTITIGQIASVGGGVPGMATPAWQAMDAWVAYVNDHGGVLGRKIEVVQKDDGADCATYTGAINDLEPEVFALVGTISFKDNCGAEPMAANPSLSNIYGVPFFPPTYDGKNNFAAFSQPSGYYTSGFGWVKEKYPDAIDKLAIVWPTDYNLKVQKMTAESLGFKVIYDAQTQLNQTDFTSEILRMKDAGVRVVELSANPTNVDAAFVQQAEQQGFHPDVIIAAGAYQPGFFDLLGDSTGENIIAPLNYPMYQGEDRDSNGALNVYLTQLEKVHSGAKGDYFGMVGWAAGVMFVQALEDAAKNGPVTRETFQDALNNISQFTAGGMLPPTNGAFADRDGASCVAIIGVKDGKFVRIDPAEGGYRCGYPYNVIPSSELG